MKASDFKKGDRVNHHKRFGRGIVIDLDILKNQVDVLFDRAVGWPRRRKLIAEYLEKQAETDKK